MELLSIARLALAMLCMLACFGCSGGAGAFGTVVVDAGHGGWDRGGIARTGMNEKDLALDTAKRLKSALQWRGYHVIMTRTNDTFIPLDNRVAVANRTFNSIFVSVHYNWDRGSSGHGVETYYCSPRSQRLAANVQRKLASAYSTRSRGVKRGCWIRVLRKSTRPAILVECGFNSNPFENAQLQKGSVRQRIADAIANGIVAERRGQRP
jgi:N-acetylmuramoyl-L-alanine amidase